MNDHEKTTAYADAIILELDAIFSKITKKVSHADYRRIKESIKNALDTLDNEPRAIYVSEQEWTEYCTHQKQSVNRVIDKLTDVWRADDE